MGQQDCSSSMDPDKLIFMIALLIHSRVKDHLKLWGAHKENNGKIDWDLLFAAGLGEGFREE